MKKDEEIKKVIDNEIEKAISEYKNGELKKEINQETEKGLNKLIKEEVKTKLDEELNFDQNPPSNQKENSENKITYIKDKSKEQAVTAKNKIKESWNKCQGGLCLVFIFEVLAVGVLATLAGIGCSSSELFYCVEKSFFGAAPVMLIISALGLLVAIAGFVFSERDPGIGLIGVLINLPVFVLAIFLIFNYLGLIIFAIALLLWLVQLNRQSYY